MASEHYPTTAGPSESVRCLAAEILWELDHAGPEGLTAADLPASEWASERQIHRSIQWLRECGAEVVADWRGGYRLAGERRTLPAHALSRVDLLDALRGLLGPDRDPLEAIAAVLDTAGAWRRALAIDGALRCWSRRAEGCVWRVDLLPEEITLLAMRDTPKGVDVSEIQRVAAVDRLGQSDAEILAWASWQITRLGRGVREGLLWSEQIGEVATW